MGLRRSFDYALLGVPHGPLGWIGARLLASMKGKYHRAMAAELDRQADDELLDVGCGSAVLLAEHAARVRYVAGIDASELQVEMARKRLAQRIAAGTAGIVLGDGSHLPWEDGRFGVVTSLDTIKFTSDPPEILHEIYRVLRPGGRAVFTMGDNTKALLGRTDKSGTRDAWGVWSWNDADAARLVEEAGFTDVTIAVLPVPSKSQLVRATKPKPSSIDEAGKATAPVEEVMA
jgi:ubiquinone/menaquinone biosynthesis C-methylase UbiE